MAKKREWKAWMMDGDWKPWTVVWFNKKEAKHVAKISGYQGVIRVRITEDK